MTETPRYGFLKLFLVETASEDNRSPVETQTNSLRQRCSDPQRGHRNRADSSSHQRNSNRNNMTAHYPKKDTHTLNRVSTVNPWVPVAITIPTTLQPNRTTHNTPKTGFLRNPHEQPFIATVPQVAIFNHADKPKQGLPSKEKRSTITSATADLTRESQTTTRQTNITT